MKNRNLREMEKHWAKEAERKAKLAKSKAPAVTPPSQPETANKVADVPGKKAKKTK